MNTSLPAPSVADSAEPAPIYVDLDGTLLRSDLLYESFMGMLRHRPLRALQLPFWLMRGKAHLKAQLAKFGDVDVSTLPYREEVLSYLKEKAALGHEIVLATASNERLARAVAAHLGIFTRVLASSETNNLKGANKERAIRADAKGQPFWYAGNDAADLPVWEKSAGAILVNTSASVAARARNVAQVEKEVPGEPAGLRAYVRAIRAYQWAKNALVFVPLITAHLITDPASILQTVIAFAAFSLSASAIYLLNDLLDLPSDRRHPRKRLRPMASGVVSIRAALALFPILLAAGFAMGSTLGMGFMAVLAVYVATTCAYSFHLKSYVLIDVGVLAALYTIRVFGGAAAINVELSFWLLAFSAFLFLSLALIKRCSELLMLPNIKRTEAHGRDYRVVDQAILQSIGVTSGFAAVLVLALFINSEDIAAKYEYPKLLWLLCASVTYWIARMWLKTTRGEMHDDPLLYAARDRGSIFVVLASFIIVIAAI